MGLRILSPVFKLLAWLVAVGTVTVVFFILFKNNTEVVPYLGTITKAPNLFWVAFVAVFGLVNFLIFYAVGESILVFLSIEENLSKMAEKHNG